MQRLSLHRRGRALASLVTVAGLGLVAAAVATTPAQADGPAGDCTPAYPAADVASGQAVHGLTVSKGTTPDPFTGEVLGVLNDGIAPGIDMIMVRLTSPEIDRVGIWEGMSGSPVYIDTPGGPELVGAVAYGLASGPSPVAGVTPFEDMDDYLAGAPSAKVAVGRAAARTIAAKTDVSAADASQGFRQIPLPMGVAGVGADRLADAATRASAHRYLPKQAYAVGRASAAAAGPDTIVAGGNLAGSLSYGDITMAGVGTATWTCAGQVIGFGHPLAHYGQTTLTMHPADAIYVQEDMFAGFKLANLGAPAGTITQDRGTGITGVLGPVPDTALVDSTVTWGARSRTGSSHVSVRTPDSLASTTFYQFLANQDRVVDGSLDGSEVASWTVTGTGPTGSPFSLTSANRYTSDWDLGEETGFSLGDIVYALAGINGVTIDSVSTNATPETGSPIYRLSKVERKAGGHWVELGQRRPTAVHAGRTLHLRATLSTAGGNVLVPVNVQLPARLAGRNAFLAVVGGQNTGGLGPMNSLAQARKSVADLVRNDQLQVELVSVGRRGGSGHSAGGGHSTSGGARGDGGVGTVSTKVLGPYQGVVRGQRMAPLVVR